MGTGNQEPQKGEGGKGSEKDAEYSILGKLEEIRQAMVVKTSDDLTDLLHLTRSTRRILITNFVTGAARGAGFFIGASFIGAILLALLLLVASVVADKVGAQEEWQSFTSAVNDLRAIIQSERERREKTMVSGEQEMTPAEAPGGKEKGTPSPAPSGKGGQGGAQTASPPG